jgi:hypothetical protein
MLSGNGERTTGAASNGMSCSEFLDVGALLCPGGGWDRALYSGLTG